MTLEYAQSGLVGVLTPQANTTVEPEFGVLLPPGIAAITARMTSGAPDLHDRLRHYINHLDDWIGQFGNAPLDVVAMACTGASYLVGAERERDILAGHILPVVTSGQAVVAALRVLSARRVALISPYSQELTEASVHYWESFGVSIVRVVSISGQAGAFHQIYGIGSRVAVAALDTLADEAGLDAIVMLGTGLPTLSAILHRPVVNGAPVFSCMLATAWRAVLVARRETPSAANLLAWISQPHWATRLAARTGVTL